MGKKKSGKKAWKPVPVDDFLDANVKKCTWADEVDQEYKDSDINDFTPKPVVLPTAPRASRASDFDESKVPHVGPFQIHVSNIPYELEDQELADFFGGLDITSIRLPKEDGKRAKGYGYVEFANRQSLIAALNKPDTVLKTRPVKIELSTGDSGRGGMNRGGRGGNRDGGMRGGDMGDPDRTSGNWRSGPRSDYDDRPNFDRGAGGGYVGGGRREFSSGSGGGYNRGGYDREDRGSSRDDRGYGGDRDRGDRYRRDDFDRGPMRDRDDRGGYNRSRGGLDDDRREERGGGGGSWRDGGNREGGGGGFRGYDDRREDRGPPPSRYGDRGPSRRDDLPPPDRAPPVERKKLNLQPRSVNPAAENKPVSAAAQSAIFGGAKPVDTTAREREVEERLIRGDDGVDKIRSGPSSTSGGSVKDVNEGSDRGGGREKPVEPAPPPKENAWHRKPTSPVINNGRTSPPSNDDRNDSQRSWGRGEPKRPEPRSNDDQRSTKPPPKTGPPGGPDRARTRDDRPPNKSREPRNIDDLSKMPKLVESKTPNYVGANKFVALEDDDAAE